LRRIPSTVFDFPSSAEQWVFSLLHGVDIGNEWVALHSLNCSEHLYKKWSEIDFLLIGPDGIFVLEVKGGNVSCDDGVWTTRTRAGVRARLNESPVTQAKTARYSLERLLKDRFGLLELGRPPCFGFGVVFPDIPWPSESPEMPRTLLADRQQCASSQAFGQYLRKLVSYWRGKFDHAPGTSLSTRDRKRLLQALRPDFDVYPPFTLRLGQVKREMHTLTEEQFERMDIIEANQQAIISGGAGTGKTFLLMQCARKEAANGRSVLVVVESDVLAAHLRKLEPNREVRIESFDNVREKATSPAEVLFVDEGQDLLTLEHFEVLNSAVTGGLAEGRWRWFMDENNQSHLRGAFSGEVLDLLKDGLGRKRPVLLPLHDNVRNTKQIIAAVEHWTGAELGRTRMRGHGERPRIICASSLDEIVKAVGTRLEELRNLDVSLEEIGLIAPKSIIERLVANLPSQLRRKCLLLDPTTVRAKLENRLVAGCASVFKGLERSIVIVVEGGGSEDLEVERAELYVASTRANYDLTVITDNPNRFPTPTYISEQE
jgi:hypothetical protein